MAMALVFFVSSPSLADRARVPEQDALRNGVRAGAILPFTELRARAQSRVDGEYVGTEFLGADRYRFKFQRGSSVIWMDMDGRTGREVGRTGE